MKKGTTTIEDFSLVMSPKGYFNKREITNMEANCLVKGSKNVYINDADKVSTRFGYVTDGTAKTMNKGIDSFYDWASTLGLVVVRSNQGATAGNGVLQVRHHDYTTPTTVVYRTILSSLTLTDYAYSSWWSTTENKDFLLFVDGTTKIRMWSGAVGFVDAQGAGGVTLTLLGGGTWKESGFLSVLSGRAVTINGVSYTYTGGEGTATLTGLSGLPAITQGQFVSQTVVENTGLTGLPATYTFNVIDVQNNNLYLGSTSSRVVYVSKSTSYLDFTYGSPVRVKTDGWVMTLDDYTVGFVQDNDVMYVTSGVDGNYKITRITTADGTGETFKVQKQRGGSSQAALSQSAVIQVKNGIAYVSNERTLDWFTSIENIDTPQSLPISDPIKKDFLEYNLTGVSLKYYRNQLWIAVPAENLVIMYDFNKALWNPPFTIPVVGFSVINNDLYGHSSFENETYKLNTGTTDKGVAIEFNASFAYRQYGDRTILYQYNRFYTEVYMSQSTNLTISHKFEYGGFRQIINKTMSGADNTILFAPAYDSSLGKNPLGESPLGSNANDVQELNKYRCIHTLKAVDFFENQIVFTSDTKGAQFEILAHGAAIRKSTNLPRSITK